MKLKVGNQYIIPFKGLKEGKHDFGFEIGDEFFEANDELSIPGGNLIANIVLQKKSNFLDLDVELKGTVEVECDRCTEFFSYPLSFKGRLVVKFKEESDVPDDEIMFLHPGTDLLDLNQYFFDCIGLSIPIQKFHPDKENGSAGCDEKILKILDNYSDSKKNNIIDPRWSKLNDLLNDKNKK